MRLVALLAVLSLGAGMLACGRHVVLDPIDVVRSNDPTWQILREPNPDGGAAPPVPPGR
jgi:hypothetical protein